jgi:Na+/proline symporter
MYFLTTRPVWVLCLLALLLTLLAMGGPLLVRRYVSLDSLATNNEVAGFKFAALGVLYAVLLAFAVIVVWQRFNDAETAVAAEAGAAATLYRLALGMGERGTVLHAQLSEYLQADATRDWPEMQHGRTSQAASDALTQLYVVALAYQPTDPRGAGIQQDLLRQLGALTQARRDRLVMAAGAVPGIIWLVLFTGAVLTISFTFFFGTVNVRNQSVMTGALALLIFSVLVIVVAIDRPFAGPVQISAEPLLQVRANFQGP